MKKSVKLKITLWITGLVALLTVVLVSMALFISNYVATETIMERMEYVVRGNIKHIQATDTTPVIDEEFLYYQNGISTLVYSRNGSLLAGQLPVNFKTAADFENGIIRTVESGDNKFIVLDMWLPYNLETGFWIRGISDVPDMDYLARYLLMVSAITLPVFTLLAALGSWLIIRKSFRPLDRINATAKAINEAKDLSGRINLTEGDDEFSYLADNFDDMLSRLESSFEAEKQFTADASHELRTPVAVIKSACEYGRKYDETAEEHAETLAVIGRQADKMSALINQLLSMTRMEQGTEKFTFEQLNLSEIVKEFCAEADWEKYNIKVFCDEKVAVKADKALLQRLLYNLVENAVKYGREDGEISVSVTEKGNSAVLTVKDEGEGIPAEHIEKIWNRFYQADPSRNNDSSGAGLGLSIVQQIARLHGGFMTVESTVGKGSAFSLHLPLIRE